jgi:hypothetical protein
MFEGVIILRNLIKLGVVVLLKYPFVSWCREGYVISWVTSRHANTVCRR